VITSALFIVPRQDTKHYYGLCCLAYPVIHFLLQATREDTTLSQLNVILSLNPELKFHLSPSIISSPLPSSWK